MNSAARITTMMMAMVAAIMYSSRLAVVVLSPFPLPSPLAAAVAPTPVTAYDL